ncbi:MAG: helicase-exonuclease AddAB subunit AddB [Eubacteriales bacterium]
MSLRFIMGRAGTGKTHACLKEIQDQINKNSDNPFLLLFLVPEQVTFQMEVSLLAGLKGTYRALALSFRRLAWHILSETGGISRMSVGELGKQMILRKLLMEKRKELKVFQQLTNYPGFIKNLSDAISEAKQYGLNGLHLSDLTDRFAEKEGILSDKLKDFALLLSSYEKYLGEQYLDPDGYLDLLAGKIAFSRFAQGSEIWIDCFSGFNSQEYRVIGELLKVAKRVSITLCLDSRSAEDAPEESDVFYPALEVLEKIKALAGQYGIIIEKPLCLDNDLPLRYKDVPCLAHLEKDFFVQGGGLFRDQPAGIKLIAAANRYAEVEGVAREIIHLCREKGYRWKDISVVLRKVEIYWPLIDTVFNDYGIPFFIDVKREVGHHPLAALIKAALEVITSGWSYDSVFGYLKTGLTAVGQDDIDILENYVLAHGIKGSRWTDSEDWQYERRYTAGGEEYPGSVEINKLSEINRIRRAAVKEIADFQAAVAQSATIREITAALFELITSLNVFEQLNLLSGKAREDGNPDAAQEHTQIWNAIIELFDQLAETLGDERAATGDYLKIIQTGLEGIRLGLIPPGLDQVLIASLERSRNPNVKACFVPGVNDGLLPARPEQKGLFTDFERENIEAAGLILSPSGRRLLFNEQFLVYIALTRSSEFLWVSYALSDQEGYALAPSPVIQRLKKIFPGLAEVFLPVYPPGDEDRDLHYVAGAERTLTYLAVQLRECRSSGRLAPLWRSVYNWFIKQPQYRDKCEKMFSGLFYKNNEDPLKKDLSLSLFGNPLKTSVSRLERYYSCPFAHFLTYGLKLRERAVFKLERPDLGEFYHTCLKLFVEKSLQGKQDLKNLNIEQCSQIAGEIVSEVAPSLRDEILLSSPRYRYLTTRLQRTVERAVYSLSTHAGRSAFKPVAAEASFSRLGQFPAFELPVAGDLKMEINGRIDRIDAAEWGDSHYLRVIDYKSGPAELNLVKIFYGLQLQLLIYLDVAIHFAGCLIGVEALPAGVFYFNVSDPVTGVSRPPQPGEIETLTAKKLKMRGLVLAEPGVIRLMDSQVNGLSDLIPAGLKKDGGLYNSSSLVTVKQLADLRVFLRKVAAAAGKRILGGSAEIKPYRYKTQTACAYCEYKPVCSFDPLLPENKYRQIPALAREYIWKVLSKGS